MVKIIRLFCIVGIIALLALIVGYTELKIKEKTPKAIIQID